MNVNNTFKITSVTTSFPKVITPEESLVVFPCRG